MGREDGHLDARRRVQQRARAARARGLRGGIDHPAQRDDRLHDRVRPSTRPRLHRVPRARALHPSPASRGLLACGRHRIRSHLRAATGVRSVVCRGPRHALRGEAVARRRAPALADLHRHVRRRLRAQPRRRWRHVAIRPARERGQPLPRRHDVPAVLDRDLRRSRAVARDRRRGPRAHRLVLHGHVRDRVRQVVQAAARRVRRVDPRHVPGARSPGDAAPHRRARQRRALRSRTRRDGSLGRGRRRPTAEARRARRERRHARRRRARGDPAAAHARTGIAAAGVGLVDHRRWPAGVADDDRPRRDVRSAAHGALAARRLARARGQQRARPGADDRPARPHLLLRVGRRRHMEPGRV